MTDAKAFLARWSRLKREARAPKPPAAAAPPPEAAPAQEAPPLETPPAELPPLESLTAESDFSVFMRPGVAQSVRNAALQKLWRSDPVFANLDGLLEYGEDYAAAFKSEAVVDTVYRVLLGMPDPEKPKTAESAAAEAPGAPPQAPALPPSAEPGEDAKPAQSGAEPAVASGGRAGKYPLD